MQAWPEDLKGAATAAALSKVSDAPSEKFRDAPPEIKAKLGAESRN